MALNRQALFTSDKENYETPPDLFDRFDRLFHFNLDVCASLGNAKTPYYIHPDTDALRPSLSWARIWELYSSWPEQQLSARIMAWMNPPYGRNIEAWVRRAAQTWQDGASVVSLLPARTDTSWFQNIVLDAPLVLLLKSRVGFYLPCNVCDKRTRMLYKVDYAEASQKLYSPSASPVFADLKLERFRKQVENIPLCEDHALPDWPKKKVYKSTAPFPSAVVFFVQRDRLKRIESIDYQLGDLGRFIRTVPC